MRAAEKPLEIVVNETTTVSGLFLCPDKPLAAVVLGHGAGAGMQHPSMGALARGLYDRDIATLRCQFPYMQKGGGRPDPPALCHATLRAAADKGLELLPMTPWFAGGRSFGGRMSSQASAAGLLGNIRGLIFFAFPLHPAGKPDDSRAEHLSKVAVPMLFLQGGRDALADLKLLKPVVAKLGDSAELKLFEHADHSFHVPVKSGRTDAQVRDEMLDEVRNWISARCA